MQVSRRFSDNALSIEAQFSQTIFENRSLLLGIAKAVVKDEHAAEDILQKAYIRLVDAREQYLINDHLSYCCTVVKNLAIDHHRHKKFELSGIDFDVDIDELPVSSSHCPYKIFCVKETLEQMVDILSELPEKTQQIFIFYRLECLTQREIAARLGCSLGSVNEHIAAADRALKACKQAVLWDIDIGEDD